eukprot:TRINITY_DN7066_c0_g1_i1.p1 TRINITY_DN7066_c0_g1~~TRINITY_DN7066_c0_g1_i1.p1  ORF type:complete len:514 (-),score=90.78 TRINITY_DN7066_c0_g1_i1:69-1610(-)
MKLQVLVGVALAGYCQLQRLEAVKLADPASAKDLPFKEDWFKAAGFVQDNNGRWVHSLTNNGAHEACNWQCYLDKNPDLQRTYGPHNIAAAEKHWHEFGSAERRDCTCSPTSQQLAATVSNGKEAVACAEHEGDSCDCKGTVFFGRKYTTGIPGFGYHTNLEQLKHTGFVEKQSSGRVTCSSAAMGRDPVKDQFKYCLCASSQNPPGTPAASQKLQGMSAAAASTSAASQKLQGMLAAAASKPSPPAPPIIPPFFELPPPVTMQLPLGPGLSDEGGKASIAAVGKVLLFMTTYGPPDHMTMLKGWPTVMKGQPMLTSADVFLYACGDKAGKINLPDKKEFEELLGHFPNKHKTLYYTYDNPGYQTGAVKAAFLGFNKGWFNGYDWVIRLNSDVLIYQEAQLVRLMSNPNKDLVLNSCWDSACESKCVGRMVMTDMFVIRPKALPANAFSSWATTYNAESATTREFQHLVSQGRDSWLDRENSDRACRSRGHGIWHENANFVNLWARKPWLKSA